MQDNRNLDYVTIGIVLIHQLRSSKISVVARLLNNVVVTLGDSVNGVVIDDFVGITPYVLILAVHVNVIAVNIICRVAQMFFKIKFVDLVKYHFQFCCHNPLFPSRSSRRSIQPCRRIQLYAARCCSTDCGTRVVTAKLINFGLKTP